MNKIVNYPYGSTEEYRKQFTFVNRSIRVQNEDDFDSDTYPCIILKEINTNLPIAYTGYERFIQPLGSIEMNKGSYLAKMANEICKFLNYVLQNTTYCSINECSICDIRNFMVFIKKKRWFTI